MLAVKVRLPYQHSVPPVPSWYAQQGGLPPDAVAPRRGLDGTGA